VDEGLEKLPPWRPPGYNCTLLHSRASWSAGYRLININETSLLRRLYTFWTRSILSRYRCRRGLLGRNRSDLTIIDSSFGITLYVSWVGRRGGTKASKEVSQWRSTSSFATCGGSMARRKSFTALLASGNAGMSHAIAHDPKNLACLSSCHCANDSSGVGCTFESCALLCSRKRAPLEGPDDGEAFKRVATPPQPLLSITQSLTFGDGGTRRASHGRRIVCQKLRLGDGGEVTVFQ
jgi:hypothetical protein